MAASLPHLLLIVRAFHADGPGRLVHGLLSAWQPDQLRVSLFSLGSEGILRGAVEQEIARLGGQVKVRPTGWLSVGAAAREAEQFARQSGATALAAHLMRPDAVARKVSAATGLPYLYTEHGIHAWADKGRWVRPFARRWFLGTMPPHMRVVAVSHKVERDLLREGVPRERVARVLNGVDLNRNRPATSEEKAEAREALGVAPMAGPVVLTIGGLVPGKRVDVALRALAQLWITRSMQVDSPRLLVVGGGLLAHRLKELAKSLNLTPHVMFTGALADPTSAYRAADVLVHPSEQESFGLVVAEGLAHGLPVVVRKGSGADELLPTSPAAIAVEGDDPKDWAAAIKSACAAAEEARQLHRAHAEQEFSLSRCAEDYLKLL